MSGHQGARDPQADISIPAPQAMLPLPPSSRRACGGGLDVDDKLRLNLSKTEWLWVQGASGCGRLSFLVLDGGHTASDRPGAQSGGSPGPGTPAQRARWQFWLRGPLHNRVVHQLCPFLGSFTQAPVTLGRLQCALHGATLEEHPKVHWYRTQLCGQFLGPRGRPVLPCFSVSCPGCQFASRSGSRCWLSH